MEFINLSSTASTLLITLYSRAAMSKNNMIIEDKKAEQIIAIAGYDQKKLKVSKKLQALLTIRAYLIDVYTKEFIEKHNSDCNIIQLGCGLDSRYIRINNDKIKWYDLDFYATIEMRKKYYKNSTNYKMIASNVCNFAWIKEIVDLNKPTLIIGEGLFMYLDRKENESVLNKLANTFPTCELIMDVFNTPSVAFSRFAPSLRRVHANLSFGFNNHSVIEKMTPFKHIKTQYYYDCKKINDLPFLLRTRFKIRRDLKIFKKVQRIEVYHN
jgi:O-methyltransferase involved in polyketide biosynthesis